MRRLRPLDAVLLVVLVPLWVVCFTLYVKVVARGRLAWVPVSVRAPENAESYPTVREFLPGTGAGGSGLVIGDRLIRLGQADLRGVGPFGFVARAYEEAGSDLRVPVAFVRAGEQGETSLSLTPIASPWLFLPLTLSFVIAGVLTILCEPGSRSARAFFLASLAYSFHWTLFFGGPRMQTYAWAAVHFFSALVMLPLSLRAVMIFPEKLILAGTQTPAWPWLFAISGPIIISTVFGVPLPPTLGLRANFVVNVAFLIALLVLLTRNFRRANPVGRRQLKWIVYGLYTGTVPVLAADVVTALDPALRWLHEISMIAPMLIPICLCIAIVRFNLFDIDRLISATAASSILLVLLIGGALLGGPQLSRATSGVVGVDPASGQIVFQLLLVALVVPGQRYLHPWIERLFFPERHALERGVEHLLRELSACEGPQALLTLVSERLYTLLRPECCVMYGRVGESYAPAFVRGSAVPPVIAAYSSLVGALQTRAAPVDVERWRRTARVYLGPADRAALDSLRVAVVLPISRNEPPAAFVCLGHKRSGDIYTTTDYALLAAVADKVAGELLRFDEAEIHRQARVMQDALRRYVPEPVAARLASGQEPEAGEREISVLFVDIRGYTTHSEGWTNAENFSVVNRYTETVSRVIRHYGGTIVEFTGDGVMAVFGAPDPLLQKERAAVEAGRAIVAAVRSLAPERAGPKSRPLEVGVGIATGQAFVGNIQSVDRLIWTAIGNTANLGARLQSLTRDLNAAIVIDAATWVAAGESAADFERHERMPIRGYRRTEDVYALPLVAQAVRT
jgi:class 3 adenylate cyclase